MTPGAPDVDSPRDVSSAAPPMRRERVVVRRRRPHSRHRIPQWTVRMSHRRMLRAFVVCTGVLVLMAVGLYCGLARQDNPPAGALPTFAGAGALAA